jgi:hypothetical protein
MPVKTIKKIIIPVTGIFLILIACKTDTKPDENQLAKLYVETLILEEQHAGQSDSLEYYKSQLFEKEGISKESFNTQINAMGSDPIKWKEFFALSNKYLDTLKSRLNKPSK